MKRKVNPFLRKSIKRRISRFSLSTEVISFMNHNDFNYNVSFIVETILMNYWSGYPMRKIIKLVNQNIKDLSALEITNVINFLNIVDSNNSFHIEVSDGKFTCVKGE